MKKKSPNGLFYSSLFVVGSVTFSYTSTNLAALYILGELGGDPSTGFYTVSLFGIGNCLSVPLGLAINSRARKARTSIICLILFVLVAFFLGLAPNFPIYCFFRFLQGFVSGPILILIPSLFNAIATNEQRQNFSKNNTAIFITVSTLAACLGGTIAYEWNWRWIFLIDGGIPTIASLILYTYLKNEREIIQEKPFDYLGYAAYFTTILSISLFLIWGQELDWFTSRILITLFITFWLSLPLLVIQLIIHPNPSLKFNFLSSKTMIIALIQLVVLFGTYYGMLFMLSNWLYLYAAYTPYWISLVLGSMLLSTAVVFRLAYYLQERSSPQFLILGITCILIASVMTMLYDVDVNLFRLSASRIITGVGLALFVPPLLFMVINCCDDKTGIEGVAFFHIARTLGSGLGLAIIATIWERRQAFYHLRLGSQLVPLSDPLFQFVQRLKDSQFTPSMYKSALNFALDREAVSLALNDCFYLIAILMGILLVLLLGLLATKKPLHETNNSLS